MVVGSAPMRTQNSANFGFLCTKSNINKREIYLCVSLYDGAVVSVVCVCGVDMDAFVDCGPAVVYILIVYT